MLDGVKFEVAYSVKYCAQIYEIDCNSQVKICLSSSGR